MYNELINLTYKDGTYIASVEFNEENKPPYFHDLRFMDYSLDEVIDKLQRENNVFVAPKFFADNTTQYYYQNKENGNLLTYDEAIEEAEDIYEWGDPRTSLPFTEYYEKTDMKVVEKNIEPEQREMPLTKEDIINDVKREGEIYLGRPLTDEEIDRTCDAMVSEFSTYLYENGFYNENKIYSQEELKADIDYFNETFVDNLKSTLSDVQDIIKHEKEEAEYSERIKENFPKELKGFNRSNDINGNAVLKAFYKDGTNEMIRGGRVQDFYNRYNLKFKDFNKSYKTVDGLRNSKLNSTKELDER